MGYNPIAMLGTTKRGVNGLALFIFIPFCKIKCTYCDFNAYANLARVVEPYVDAVAREIEMWQMTDAQRDVILSEAKNTCTARRCRCLVHGSETLRSAQGDRWSAPLRAKSIYFGGGTPSIVPVAHIAKILRACERAFLFAPDIEITLEANPGTVGFDKLRALRALGVNRLSLGVQSFDDAVLRRLNRGHTIADALETFDLARRAGFDNINLDFIYGLPLQTLDDWRATLERALALAPEHLSLYALTIEEGTGLKFQIARGKYPMPDDDLAAEMYTLAEERLNAAGYAQYEISNWGKDGMWNEESGIRNPHPTVHVPRSASQHNLTYWRNEPYLGFGAGAHSCFGGARDWNVLSPLEYIQRIERGGSVVAGREENSRALEMAETMILGLRLNEGIALDAFAKRYGEDAREKYARQLRELRELELIELSDERVQLTARGRLLSNEAFWRFLP